MLLQLLSLLPLPVLLRSLLLLLPPPPPWLLLPLLPRVLVQVPLPLLL